MKIHQYLSEEEITRLMMRQAQTQFIQVTFSSGALTQTVTHRLNRVPIKWAVVKKSATADVFGSDDAEKITLTATAPCVVTLEVL
jgi:hypothetical protein